MRHTPGSTKTHTAAMPSTPPQAGELPYANATRVCIRTRYYEIHRINALRALGNDGRAGVGGVATLFPFFPKTEQRAEPYSRRCFMSRVDAGFPCPPVGIYQKC